MIFFWEMVMVTNLIDCPYTVYLASLFMAMLLYLVKGGTILHYLLFVFRIFFLIFEYNKGGRNL